MDVNTCNGEFNIDAKLTSYVEDDQIRYELVKIPLSKKQYELEEIDYHTYIDDPNKTVFYQGQNKETDEFALYWYFLFEELRLPLANLTRLSLRSCLREGAAENPC